MTIDRPGPTAPFFRILVSFPIACFSGALITDIVYVETANMMWADFSAWLLAGGMLMGCLAAVVGIFDLAANRRIRPRRPVLALSFGGLLVLMLGLLNNFVHSRDAWTSVAPTGLGLSAVTLVVILMTAWRDSAAVNRASAVVVYERVGP